MTVGNSNSFESIGLYVILFLNLAHGQMLKQNYVNLNWRPLPFPFPVVNDVSIVEPSSALNHE